MLLLTPTALEAVRTITAAKNSSEDSGLRIFATADTEELQISLAAAPAENDQVLAAEGSRIFLDQRAAAQLDDKILDTQTDPDGNGAFVIVPQALPGH